LTNKTMYHGKVKGEVVPVLLTEHHAMEAYWGSEGVAPRGEWSASCPGRFTPRERDPGTHWIGGWVGPKAVLDAVVKRIISSPRRESNPRTPIVQSVARRYTHWATTALTMYHDCY
jgi:hypothetical protein